MNHLLPVQPEFSGKLGCLFFRSNLDDFSITIGMKDWQHWDTDTQQISIAPNLIHFVQPDGSIVGLKVLGCEY